MAWGGRGEAGRCGKPGVLRSSSSKEIWGLIQCRSPSLFDQKHFLLVPHGQLLLDVAFAKFEPAAVWAKPRAHWRRWSFPILSGTGEAGEGGAPEPGQSPLITGGLRNAAPPPVCEYKYAKGRGDGSLDQ